MSFLPNRNSFRVFGQCLAHQNIYSNALLFIMRKNISSWYLFCRGRNPSSLACSKYFWYTNSAFSSIISYPKFNIILLTTSLNTLYILIGIPPISTIPCTLLPPYRCIYAATINEPKEWKIITTFFFLSTFYIMLAIIDAYFYIDAYLTSYMYCQWERLVDYGDIPLGMQVQYQPWRVRPAYQLGLGGMPVKQRKKYELVRGYFGVFVMRCRFIMERFRTIQLLNMIYFQVRVSN